MRIRNVRNVAQTIKGITINPGEEKYIPGLTKEEIMTGPLRTRVRIAEGVRPLATRPLRRPMNRN